MKLPLSRSFLASAPLPGLRLRVLSLSLPLLTGLALAQDRVAIESPPPEAAPDRETVAGGEVILVPVGPRDDSVPRPVRRLDQAGTLGDTHLDEASGDPFFLGFVAGPYYPPADETLDPRLVEQAAAPSAQRANGETYAYVMFGKRMTDARIAVLESLGARFLGRHPHYAVKVAMAPHTLQAVADLDFVRWVGLPQTWQKVHPVLESRIAETVGDTPVEVYVTTYESDKNGASSFEYVGDASEVSPGAASAAALTDTYRAKRWMSNGWQQQALEAAGLEVSSYHDSITAFRGRLAPSKLAALRDLDFVQFVEPYLVPSPAHDESMPLVNADLTRVTDTGGTFGKAVVGEVDTGIEYGHSGINHYWGWGWDLAGTSGGAWDDVHGHGSHVAGTLLGKPTSDKLALAGVAPGVGATQSLRVFNVKVFDDFGSWGFGLNLSDVFDRLHDDLTDGSGNTTPRPHVINHSWGTPSASNWSWVGTEASAREVDNEVYIYRQLHVFSAGNRGAHGAGSIDLEATAKNALAVGNVVPYEIAGVGPTGQVAPSSSRGPCDDGRWKPNLCAPGTGIESVDSSTSNGYSIKTGTSMATPHVTGIAAQLVDRYDFLRYNPPTLSAVLMATSMARNNAVLGQLSGALGHLNAYGTGRVDAYRARSGDSQQALYFWGFGTDGSTTSELPFTVGSGATRMTVVMSYHETAGSPGGAEALNNDLDMYLDREPFTGSGNSGDYYAHQSSTDNVEVRTLTNPGSGNWKVKVFPEDVAGFFKPVIGVCVVVSYGDTTPDGTFTLDVNKAYAKPGETLFFDASVFNPSYIASAVYLKSDPSPGLQLTGVQSVLADGSISGLHDNYSMGADVTLGNIVHGQTRRVVWHGNWMTQGQRTFKVDLISENMGFETKTVHVIVDGTAPSAPGNVQSSTHSVSGHYCGNQTVTTTWAAASDPLSGVDGYALSWSTQPDSDPGTAIDTTGLTHTQSISAQALPWYFHVRAIDRAGNAGALVHLGPFFVGESTVTDYCNSNLNSTGQMGLLETAGTTCLATNSLTLRTRHLPSNVFGYYLFSDAQGNVPFFGGSEGVLCLGAPIIRFANDILSSGANGVMEFSPDLSDLPQNTTIQPGSAWNFQLWYRDGQKSNTSNGIEIVFD